jgi:hypothetical protein
MSGGVMRDMVALVRQATLQAEEAKKEQIDVPAAQEAVKKMRRDMEAGLYKSHYRALDQIERSGGLIDQDDKAQMDLLRDRYVVSYENGGFWRDVHPIARAILDDYRASMDSRHS